MKTKKKHAFCNKNTNPNTPRLLQCNKLPATRTRSTRHNCNKVSHLLKAKEISFHFLSILQEHGDAQFLQKYA